MYIYYCKILERIRFLMSKYDFLIVGAGLYGATFARLATDGGYKCLVIDRRDQVAGNVYTENVGGINVHKYGAHIFHTSDREVWDFAGRFAEFNRYTNTVVANFKGEIYSMPFNMYTFNKMWGVITPEEARAKLDEQIASVKIDEPKNLEEQALSLIGPDIYNKLIKGYTEKQWGRKCTDLPAFIIKRLPVRLVFDNNYFNDAYQGIPIGGYNKLIEALLSTSPSPTLPRGEGEAHQTIGKEKLPSFGEGLERGCDVLEGIDIPLNKPKCSFKLEDGQYRMTAAPSSKYLEEKAKEMRKSPTDGEMAFWNIVNGGAFEVKFRRQHVIGHYIADFVCLEKKLVIEIDGGYHTDAEQEINDQLRSQELKDWGFTVLRLKNEEVIGNPKRVEEKLRLALWLAGKAPLREGFGEAANYLVYTGQLDEFYDYKLGKLDFRTVRFETEVLDEANYQGNAVVNYTEASVPYTRIIEHKHFESFGQAVYDNPKTVISREYSTEWKPGMEPYYPVNDEKNNRLAEAYRQLAAKEEHVIFGGRLAEYKYYDMAPIIEKVMKMFEDVTE